MCAQVPRSSLGRLHYAWIAAGVTFVTLLAAAGARAAPGVLIVPLCNQFQWSRAKVSAIISVTILFYGLVGPFAAALYERLGLRRTMLLSMGLLGGGYALSTFATAYWHFMLLWGVVVGIGSGMSATVLGAAVANRWFYERRGLVTGVLIASSATGQLIFLPTLAAAVTAHGWRSAPLIVALGCAAAVPVIALVMRNKPADLGLGRYGEAYRPEDPGAPRRNPVGIAFQTLAEAVKVRDFWFLSASFFVCGASTNGLIGTHLVSAAFDCGIPEVTAASLLAMMGLFDLVGTTASGWLSDRVNSRYLLFGYYGLRGLSLLFLPKALSGPPILLTIFAVFYGLDWIATVPPTVRLTGDVFGPAKAGIVFGWIAAAHQVGAACATYSAGYVRTVFGTYSPAFVGAGILCIIAAGGVVAIARPPEAGPRGAPA